MIKDLFINFYPIHLSVRSCDKAVKRYVHKRNYFSHISLFLLFFAKAITFHIVCVENYRRRLRHQQRRKKKEFVIYYSISFTILCSVFVIYTTPFLSTATP